MTSSASRLRWRSGTSQQRLTIAGNQDIRCDVPPFNDVVREATISAEQTIPAAAAQGVPMGALGRLPPEIRNGIYKLVLDDPVFSGHLLRIIHEHKTRGCGSDTQIRCLFTPPPLLTTCRQIRKEMLPLFVSSNTLMIRYKTVRDRWQSYAWMRAIGRLGLSVRRAAFEIQFKTENGRLGHDLILVEFRGGDWRQVRVMFRSKLRAEAPEHCKVVLAVAEELKKAKWIANGEEFLKALAWSEAVEELWRYLDPYKEI